MTLRRWLLATRDAHGLYEKTGFGPLRQPERWMERFDEPSAVATAEPIIRERP